MAKFCPECGTPVAASSSREQRKTVTVLFCDLTGSTALGERMDPEPLRALLARYFELMKAIVERHGGSVEKFIGDAVMAIFGVPTLHEDDALRAARAAVEMRDALPALGLQGRIGVMTGEVVTGTAERLATGDPVNVAARLEAAAQPGEVLIGEPTLALVHDSVEVGPVRMLELKGKSQPVPVYLLLSARGAAERQHDARFVGRQRELATLRDAWQRVLDGPRCELVTVVGDAGVGKSRLVAEVLSSVDGTVLRGRCLPYGEGITYTPVIDVLQQLDRLPPDPAASAAVRSLLGESSTATSADEIAWAFRKTLEHAAIERPLVVVFDDIQWGEATFHELIEHVALLSTGAAILLLCIARPELSERNSTWPVTLRLEPLGDDNVEELIPDRIAGNLRRRIMRAAGGNPLFITEMLAVAQEAGGEVVVPPTLQALLAARLDQLEPGERNVLERGAVEGEVFHRGAVQALAPEETHVTPRLAALVRKNLITADQPQIAGEDGFRFRHLLSRDAAYDALPKATRAELHARFATWLEQQGAELVELDGLIGYHMEQACRYRAELGLPDDAILTAGARSRLTAAGHRARQQLDNVAAVSLLKRAAAFLPAGEIDRALELELVDVLFDTGDGDEAIRWVGAFVERASAAGDRMSELCGRIKDGILRTYLEPEGATEQTAALLEQALPEFEASGDHLALYIGYAALGHLANVRAQMHEGMQAYDRAAAHAERAGVPARLFGYRSGMRFVGPTPVRDLLAWMDEQGEEGPRNANFRGFRANAMAMLGRFDDARAILADARAELADRGGGLWLAGLTGERSLEVELLAGDPAAAAAFGEAGCAMLDELGERSLLSTLLGLRGQALYALDQLGDADAVALRGAALGASDDAITQMLWRQVRAKVSARRGEHVEAERLAREAVAIGAATDMLDAQGHTYGDLAEVLLLAGNAAEGTAALEEALARYERKGNLVMSGRTRTRLAELGNPAPTRPEQRPLALPVDDDPPPR